ncbi:MAG: histidine phosphatase family protein [Bdellovibrionales bacterium]|nr:histidine phosphatase family protein [Bdellovibrionales bacterium]
MKWRLVLIRHAHRDTSDRDQDNGLSAKGKEQVKGLKRFVQARRKREEDFAQGRVMWLSSPKLRCRETLDPLVEKLAQGEAVVDLRLDEQGPGESDSELSRRIQAFIKELAHQKPDWVFVSSHGDWLPYALDLITGCPLSMKKGAWVELQMEGSKGQVVGSYPDPLIFLKL